MTALSGRRPQILECMPIRKQIQFVVTHSLSQLLAASALEREPWWSAVVHLAPRQLSGPTYDGEPDGRCERLLGALA